jgi:hypothetical protein
MAELPQGEDASNALTEIGDAIGDVISGIPAPVRKGFWKAAGRLVRGLVEVPAAALETKARDIEHRQKMKEKVRAAIVKAGIARLPDHPDLADRALEHHVDEILGKQENREKVLRFAGEELQEAQRQSALPPPTEELDDDWLNYFSGYAERATSDRARRLFGRLLAGEIRKPNSYSLFTLDLLSKISRDDAQLIVQFAPYVLGDSLIITPHVTKALTFAAGTRLGELGILAYTTIGVSNATRTIDLAQGPTLNGKRVALMRHKNKVVLFMAAEGIKLSYTCALLTKVGAEVLSLHEADIDEEMLTELAAHLRQQNGEVAIADFVDEVENQTRMTNIRVIAPPVEPPQN